MTARLCLLRFYGEIQSWRSPGRWALLFLLLAPVRLAAQESVGLDPELTRPLREVLARTNAELAARRAEVEAAQARVRAAGFAPPAVLSGEVEDVPSGYDLPGAAVRVEIGKEFLTGGRSAAARALALSDVRTGEALLYAAQRRLDARIARDLTRTIANLAIARRLAAEDSLLVGAEEALRSRFAVGEARYVDVLRLRTERLRIQNERAEALAGARIGRVGLQTLAGPRAPEGFPALVDSLIAAASARPLAGALAPIPSLDSLLAAAPALRLAEARVERARAALDFTRAEQRPRFSASLGAQRTTGENGGNQLGPVGTASVTLPFTARRANQTALEVSQREIAVAEAGRTAILTSVRADLVGAQTRYEAARERIRAFEEALLRSAREEREGALAAYRTGDLSLIELIDFERALARAEIERLRARADAAEALAELLSASAGTGVSESQ